MKINLDASVDKYKGIHVIIGYSQKSGQDYNQIFSPVAISGSQSGIEYCSIWKYAWLTLMFQLLSCMAKWKKIFSWNSQRGMMVLILFDIWSKIFMVSNKHSVVGKKVWWIFIQTKI